MHVTTYLYGFLLARNAHLVPAHISGIAASNVRVLPCEALGAIVSSLNRAPARELDDIRAHDHALQSVVNHGATAAAGRFGQVFEGDSEARSHVRDRGEHIARTLNEWDGCVEMRVLLTGRPASPSHAASGEEDRGPGRAYLDRVRADRDSLRHLALAELLHPIIRAEKIEELPNARGVAYSHLIERGTENAYRSAIRATPALSASTIVGPLALYSFAEPR
jgi:hypothetical protein